MAAVEEFSDEDVEISDATDEDSDEELRRDFASGKLKVGLNKFVPRAQRQAFNNVPGLNQKLAAIKKSVPWIETLDVTSEITSEETEDDGSKEETVHDDFKREIAFYKQAQWSVLQALPKIHKMNVSTKRPEDYFAEMLKTDDHMQRVREKLLTKQQSIERSEKARKLREIKKFGKKVQHEVLEKRQKEKKEMLDSVKKFRKGKQGRPSFLDEDGDEGKFDITRKGNSQNKKEDQKRQSRKRKGKDQKYGFGGQKKMKKRNTADSSADMSSFSSSKHSKAPRSQRKPQGKKKNFRPGKSRRQKMKK